MTASQPQNAGTPLDAVQNMLAAAINNNRVTEQVTAQSADPVIVRLSQDAGHLKFIVYFLGFGMVALLIVGWNLFLHMDGKIEHKADYLNGRIDGIMASERQDSAAVPAQPEPLPKPKNNPNK